MTLGKVSGSFSAAALNSLPTFLERTESLIMDLSYTRRGAVEPMMMAGLAGLSEVLVRESRSGRRGVNCESAAALNQKHIISTSR